MSIMYHNYSWDETPASGRKPPLHPSSLKRRDRAIASPSGCSSTSLPKKYSYSDMLSLTRKSLIRKVGKSCYFDSFTNRKLLHLNSHITMIAAPPHESKIPYLLVATSNKKLQLYELSSFELLAEKKIGTIASCLYFHDATSFFCGTANGTIYYYKLVSCDGCIEFCCLDNFEQETPVEYISSFYSGYILSGNEEYGVTVVDIETGEDATIPLANFNEYVGENVGHSSEYIFLCDREIVIYNDEFCRHYTRQTERLGRVYTVCRQHKLIYTLTDDAPVSLRVIDYEMMVEETSYVFADLEVYFVDIIRDDTKNTLYVLAANGDLYTLSLSKLSKYKVLPLNKTNIFSQRLVSLTENSARLYLNYAHFYEVTMNVTDVTNELYQQGVARKMILSADSNTILFLAGSCVYVWQIEANC